MDVWVTSKSAGNLQEAIAAGPLHGLEDVVVVWDAGDRSSIVACSDKTVLDTVIASLQSAGVRFAPEKDGLYVEATGVRIEQIING